MSINSATTQLTPVSQMTGKQKVKGISFLSAILLVVGSAIGAGIFFKNKSILQGTQGNIGIAIGCWAVAAVGIIAIGLALLELAGASRRNKGLLGWTETFTFPHFHSWSKGYMALFYYPVTMVSLPLYAVQSLSDATGHMFPWWQIILLAMGLTAWILLVSAISTRMSSGLNWVFTVIKFVPIFLVPIYGFIEAGSNGFPPLVIPVDPIKGLTSASPYLGILASIPAIFFAFDGFYTVASISSDLKSPKRMPWAMGIGILIITAAYLLISAGVFVSSPTGNVGDMRGLPAAVNTVINYAIFIAVLGIVNGYGLSTYKSYDDAIVEKDFIFEKKLSKLQLILYFGKRRKAADGKTASLFKLSFTPGFNFFWMSTLAWYALVTVISAFNTYNGGNNTSYSYGGSAHEAALYSLADLLTNWSSMVIFVMIGFVLIGGLANRRSRKVKVERKWYFIPATCVAILLVMVPALYLVVRTIAGVAGYNGDDQEGNLIYLVILVGTIAMGFLFNLYYYCSGRKFTPPTALPSEAKPLPVAASNMVFVAPDTAREAFKR